MSTGEKHRYDERPRERLIKQGEKQLSTAELLSILLRTGTQSESVEQLSERLLQTFYGLQGLAKAEVSELTQIEGIGPAKAAEIKAALELGRRLLSSTPNSVTQIKCPADAANLFIPVMSLLEREEVHLLLLDTKHQVIRQTVVYVGCLANVPIRIAELFRPAIRENCAAIVMAHNHPSGDPAPSSADIRMTKEVVEAGKLLGIELVDHVVIGNNRYVSMKQEGMGF